jgi:multiple sugar transport system substrate-binding protein
MTSSRLHSRRSVIFGGASLTGVVLAACAPGEQAQAPVSTQVETLEWWSTSISPGVEAVMRDFHTKQAKYRVEAQVNNVGSDQASRDKFTSVVVAGTPPDLVYMDRLLVRGYGSFGALAELDSRLKSSKTVKTSDLWPNVVKDVTQKGKTFGMPLHTDVRMLFTHTQAFQDVGLDARTPPKTLDELETMSQRLFRRREDGGLARLGYFPFFGNPGSGFSWFIHLWQFGGETLTADERRPLFNQDPGLKALEWMVKMIQQAGGYDSLAEITGGITAPPGGFADAFTMGRMAMTLAVNTTIRVYRQGAPDLKWEIHRLPVPAGGKPANYAGGWTLVLPKNARRAEGAWTFMEYMLGKDTQLMWGEGVEAIPARMDVARSTAFLKDDVSRKVSVEELPGAKWVPTFPYAGEFLDVIRPALLAAAQGKQAPRDALNEAAAKVQPILDRNQLAN